MIGGKAWFSESFDCTNECCLSGEVAGWRQECGKRKDGQIAFRVQRAKPSYFI